MSRYVFDHLSTEQVAKLLELDLIEIKQHIRQGRREAAEAKQEDAEAFRAELQRRGAYQ